MFRASLFWKIFGSFVALILLTAVLAGWIASRRVIDDAELQTDLALRTRIDLLYELYAGLVSKPVAGDLQERVRRLGEQADTRITLIRADGSVIADSDKDPAGMDNHGTRPEVLQSLEADVGRSKRFSDTVQMPMVYMARAVRGPRGVDGYVRCSIPLVDLENRLAGLRNTVLGAASVAVLIGLIGALIAARRLSRPLRSMRDAAIAIAGGDYERRVQSAGGDELGDLGGAFNDMASKLEREITTIRRDQREVRAILGGMVEGVLAVDDGERIVMVNDAACRILGLSGANDVRGRPIWEALRLSQVPDTLSRAVRRGEVQSVVLSLPADGREQTIRLHVSPLLGETGEARGAVLVLDDITERRRLEEIRRDFIANASHELKTPVASIRGMAETVIDDPEMDVNLRRSFLDRILRQSHRLGDLVEEMLALSRLESRSDDAKGGETQDLRDPVSEVLDDREVQAQELGVTVYTEIASTPLPVRAQTEALRRIAGNLLDNAIQYTPRGGRVDIRLQLVGRDVVLEVQDTGPGIPADKHDRVFERFYRVDEGRSRGAGGTGLGLAIVKHLVIGLGGRIELESLPGSGSTFRVLLPAA